MAKKAQHEQDDEEMTAVLEKLNSVSRHQDHLSAQMEHIIRLIQGDKMLNTIRPTGIINDIKNIDDRLKVTESDVKEVAKWFNDRTKKRFIVTVNLIEWGKFIAWITGISGAIIAFFMWIAKHFQR